MTKTKQLVVEIEFVASLSEQWEGAEEQDRSDERPETSDTSRDYDELVARYAELASRAQTISEEIAVERYSESHLEESRRNLDWSVASDRHDHFKVSMPPAAALTFLDAARLDLVEVVEAGGATIKGSSSLSGELITKVALSVQWKGHAKENQTVRWSRNRSRRDRTAGRPLGPFGACCWRTILPGLWQAF
jgi:hypothetical protein